MFSLVFFVLFGSTISERRYLNDCCVDPTIGFDITSIGSTTFSGISIDQDDKHRMTLNLCSNVSPGSCTPSTTDGPTPAIDDFYDGGYHDCWWVGDSAQCSINNDDGIVLTLEGKSQTRDNNNVRTMEITFVCDTEASQPSVDITRFDAHSDTPVLGATTTIYFMNVKTDKVCDVKVGGASFFDIWMGAGGIILIVLIFGGIPLYFIVGLIIYIIRRVKNKDDPPPLSSIVLLLNFWKIFLICIWEGILYIVDFFKMLIGKCQKKNYSELGP